MHGRSERLLVLFGDLEGALGEEEDALAEVGNVFGAKPAGSGGGGMGAARERRASESGNRRSEGGEAAAG